MRLAICAGRYAFKFGRGRRGRDANQRERIEWGRATLARREMLCPILWAALFGLFNVMWRAIPLTRQQQQQELLDADGAANADLAQGFWRLS
jgi:hypothetical protein